MRLLIAALGLCAAASLGACQDELQVQITTTVLPPATEGVSYHALVLTMQGTPDASWRIASGGLPPGLALTTSAGETASIDGTPTSAGSFSFELSVKDGELDDTGDFTIEVAAGAVGAPASP